MFPSFLAFSTSVSPRGEIDIGAVSRPIVGSGISGKYCVDARLEDMRESLVETLLEDFRERFSVPLRESSSANELVLDEWYILCFALSRE
jgi:hypothetical protein